MLSSTRIPSSLITCPKNRTDLTPISDLLTFKVILTLSNLLNTALNRWSCYSRVAPNIKISSMLQRTPGIPSNNSDISLWKNSGAEEIPNGKRLNLYRPNGVINVVKAWDSSSSGNCQNPEFASSFVNHFAFRTCPSTCSVTGIGCISLSTLLFNVCKSTQILRSPDFLFESPFQSTTPWARERVQLLLRVPSLLIYSELWVTTV